MNIKLEIEKSVRGLNQNEKTIDEIKEVLDELIIEWHNPDKTTHRIARWTYENLKSVLDNLNTDDFDFYELIKPWLQRHPEDGIEKQIEDLHNFMLCWVKIAGKFGYDETEFIRILDVYEILRVFLNELKLIEIEYIKQWDIERSGDNLFQSNQNQTTISPIKPTIDWKITFKKQNKIEEIITEAKAQYISGDLSEEDYRTICKNSLEELNQMDKNDNDLLKGLFD